MPDQRSTASPCIRRAGKVDRTCAAAAASRTTTQIQNFAPDEGGLNTPGNKQNVTVTQAYTASHLTHLTAKNLETSDQVTTYLHGVTLTGSYDILSSEIYPGSTGPTDAVVYTVNRQGQRKTLTDQNGSVHTYGYDTLGRQTADLVSALVSGVDGAIRRIGRTYEVRGMVEMITSYRARREQHPPTRCSAATATSVSWSLRTKSMTAAWTSTRRLA